LTARPRLDLRLPNGNRESEKWTKAESREQAR
jgi:hypothetical protein